MAGIKKELAEKVLFIGIEYNPPVGGVAAVEYVYAQYIHPFKFISTVVPEGQARKLWRAIAGYAEFVFRLITDRKIMIVHVHGASYASFWRKRMFIYTAKWLGKKVVYHIHGGDFISFSLKHRHIVEQTIKKSDIVITLSEKLRKEYKDRFGNIELRVIKNVIEQPKINPMPHGRFTLVFLGKICGTKGIFELLEALAENKEKYKGHLLLRFGGNDETERACQYIKDNGIEDIAHFEGWVSGEKKAELFNSADALILPSWVEALPICILEAMSYSLPVIATRVGGIPDIVKNEQNGLLIEPHNKKQMIDAIDALLNNHQLCEEMGQKASATAEEYLPSRVFGKLEEVYNKLITK